VSKFIAGFLFGLILFSIPVQAAKTHKQYEYLKVYAMNLEPSDFAKYGEKGWKFCGYVSYFNDWYFIREK
jgi:hypothetical protein